MDYFDILLAKKLSGGGDTPLPDNAYLLKDVEGLPKDIATFNDGSNLPMPSLKVSIEPIQSGSGDPSPSNVRPISGWTEANVTDCGVNVWDEEWELGTINDTTGQTSPSNNNIRTKNYIPVRPNTTYYKYIGNDKSGAIFYYDKDENFILRDSSGNSGSRPFTTPNNCYFVKLALYSSYGTTYNNDIFPFMRTFIDHLTERGYKNRTVAFIENGSWAPTAAKTMQKMLENSKDLTYAQQSVKLLSSMSEANVEEIKALAKELA